MIEAARTIRAALHGEPVAYLLVAQTVHYDTAVVLDELKKQFGATAKIHWVTSSIGVMTNDGFHRGPKAR